MTNKIAQVYIGPNATCRLQKIYRYLCLFQISLKLQSKLLPVPIYSKLHEKNHVIILIIITYRKKNETA